MSLFLINTGPSNRFVLKPNARSKGRFKTKELGGQATLITSNAWAKKHFGKRTGAATVSSGELAIKSTIKNMKPATSNKEKSICGIICAGIEKQKVLMLTQTKVSFIILTTTYLFSILLV
jgi:hypothetical protein